MIQKCKNIIKLTDNYLKEKKEKKEEKKFLEKYHCEYYCPICKKGLHKLQSEVTEDENGLKIKCKNCGTETLWNRDLFALPVLVSINGEKTDKNYPTEKEMIDAYKDGNKIYINEELSEAEVLFKE